ncbi:hypothetical protein [Pseudomonas fluorescens]|uniref:hypothetical protein n=1 Tax=Pseudomonas fluorescens TaxID=294 RepID=UPI0013CEE52B|nr:hypothetical protein [Pseudomonas fluorescens]
MSHRSDSRNDACFLGLVGHMTWCFAPIQQRDVEDMDDLIVGFWPIMLKKSACPKRANIDG